MNRLARRPKARVRSRDSARQTVIVIAVGAVLAGGLFATGTYVTLRQRAVSAATAAHGDHGLYTGSVLYMPYDGRTCHQLLFDNSTGQFTDNGKVDCAGAAYQSANATPKGWSNARMQVISEGFR